MIFGEVYRNGADWKFRAIGQGFKGGLGPLAGRSASTSDQLNRRDGLRRPGCRLFFILYSGIWKL